MIVEMNIITPNSQNITIIARIMMSSHLYAPGVLSVSMPHIIPPAVSSAIPDALMRILIDFFSGIHAIRLTTTLERIMRVSPVFPLPVTYPAMIRISRKISTIMHVSSAFEILIISSFWNIPEGSLKIF